jgi:hypothetical protein
MYWSSSFIVWLPRFVCNLTQHIEY